jgi:hypothetical protein
LRLRAVHAAVLVELRDAAIAVRDGHRQR